jgi:hypothetical protein
MRSLAGVCLVFSISVTAHAQEGKAAPGAGQQAFAPFRDVFENRFGVIAGYLDKLRGSHVNAWTALGRVFGRITQKSVALLREQRYDGKPIDLAQYFRRVTRTLLRTGAERNLTFGNGLAKQMEAGINDYLERLAKIVAHFKIERSGLVEKSRRLSARIFATVRAIAQGKTKYVPGMMSALLTGYERDFGPLLQQATRLARATPDRAKALFDRIFGSFLESLQSKRG